MEKYRKKDKVYMSTFNVFASKLYVLKMVKLKKSLVPFLHPIPMQ